METGQFKYKCICEEGWMTNGLTPACQVDVDECNGTTLCSVEPPVQCININGAFLCGHCPEGYAGNGFLCGNINECASNNGGCSMSPFVECTDTVGSYRCGRCPPDHEGNGKRCEYVGLCHINNGGCHAMASCTNNGAGAGVRCSCLSGYSGSGIGPDSCFPNSMLAGCSSSPCRNGGTCEPAGTNNFTCLCTSDYIGRTCGRRRDPCWNVLCDNGGTCTIGSDGKSFLCSCRQGYTGFNCEMREQACGGMRIGVSGSFHYPVDRDTNLTHHVSCTWTIATHRHMTLVLTFQTFSLEPHEDGECKNDYLQIRDGPTSSSLSLGRFCGSDLPNNGTISSTSNQLYLYLWSDNSDGFSLSWNSSEQACGGYLSGSNQGQIISPGYPDSYPPHQDCVWEVAVSPENNINFTFSYISLESHLTCKYDFLEILDGQSEDFPTLKKFCSSESSPMISTSGPWAFIRFHSDDVSSDQGFQITYTANSVNRQACGGYFTGHEGSVQSPDHPGAYRRKGVCVWIIATATYTQVKLTFLAFDLGFCTHSSLRIRDGKDQRAPLLGVGRFCGTNSPGIVKSSGPYILIELHTNEFTTGQGFQATWMTECGGQYNYPLPPNKMGSPGWPGSYHHNLECIYTITMPLGSMVRLDLNIQMELEVETSCNKTFLEFFDGTDIFAPHVPPKVCHYEQPGLVKSSGRSLTVRFKSDTSHDYLGFEATFSPLRPTVCDIYLNKNSGNVRSRNIIRYRWHNTYMYCQLFLTTSPGTFVRLSFNVLNFDTIWGHSYCSNKDLRVEMNLPRRVTQDRRQNRYCQRSVPPAVIYPYNSIRIHYIMAGWMHQDFSARFEAVNVSDCGPSPEYMSGTIKSPNYPGPHPHSIHCVWTITVPEGHQIRLRVEDFDMELSSNCSVDHLEVRDGGFYDSPLLGKYCGPSLLGPIFSLSNRLYLSFITTSYTLGFKRGFKIDYDAGAAGCGGVLTTATGGFVSPHYPEGNPYSSECFWTIRVATGNRITLSFSHFDLESDDQCAAQYLEIRDGGRTGPVLGKFCNQRNQGSIISMTQSLWLKYKSDSSYSGAGFSAEYVTNCSSIDLRDMSGAVETPNYPEPYLHSLNCSWMIHAPIGNKVNMSFSILKLQKNREETGCGNNELTLYYRLINGSTSAFPACEGVSPNRIISSEENATLQFLSNGLNANQGFRLEWTVSGCGGVLTGTSGFLIYDNHIRNGRLVCKWEITVSPRMKVQLEIKRFRHMNFHSYVSGSLEVYAGIDRQGPLLLQLSHTLQPSQIQSVQSTGNNMFVYFEGQHLSSLKVNATFSAVPGGCGGNFTAHSSILTSPDNTGLFEPNSECEWYIQADEDHAVEFIFTTLSMNGNCSNSCVRLYDGQDSSASLITSQCGAHLPSQTLYKSNGNIMFVQLRTGDSCASENQTSYRFNATYTSSCGGTRIADDGGSIQGPKKETSATRCVWHIISQIPTRRVSLTITDFDMRANYQGLCVNNYVSVADGLDSSPNISGIIQNSYCGHSIPPTFHSRGSALTVEFFSLFSNWHTFRAVYSSADNGCGGTFTASTGSFTSPWYPDNYPLNVECVWQIDTLPGNGVLLTFSTFDLVGGFNDDYVEIRSPDINSQHIQRFYGNMAQFTRSFHDGVWIKFRSNAMDSGSGFSASWTPNFDIHLTGSSGQILLPERAVLNTEYSWTVVVHQGLQISVSTDHTIQGLCSSNYLKIYDGTVNEGILLQQICYFQNFGIQSMQSTTNEITVKFRSQHHVNSFNLTWDAVFPGTDVSRMPERGCGDLLLAIETPQNLSSPGFPLGYANDLNCVWTIQAPVGSTVVINITWIDTEKHGELCYDYVQFVDGGQNGRPMDKYCGITRNSDLIESRNQTMVVRFISDTMWNYTGFMLEYKIGCGGLISNTRGKISSPGYPGLYPPDQNCTWQVSVPTDRTIKLEWEELDIKSGENSTFDGQCNRDYLQLFNGMDVHAPPLVLENSTASGRYCGTSSPDTPETGSHYLSAMFISDDAEAGSGFSFDFTEVHLACGGELVLTDAMSSGHFNSPNYPDNYPQNVDCIWRISAPLSKAIQIDFERTFEIQSTDGCIDDYLAFHDGGSEHSPRLGDRLCGHTRPNTVKSTGKFLYVRFRTGNNSTNGGFSAKYSIARCGGTIIASLARGTLDSPDILESYRTNLLCQWVIEAPVGHYLTMNITHIGLQASENCSSGALTIIDPFQSTNVSVTSGAVDASLPDISDVGNASSLFHGCSLRATNIDGHRFLHRSYDTSDYLAYIKFWSNTVFTERAFTIHYQASLEECGGELTTPSGVITSPNYPRQYAHSRICSWDIKVRQGRKVTLSFTDLQLRGSGSSCPFDFIEIRNGLHVNSPRLGQYCGRSVPHTVSSSGNSMRFILRAANSVSNSRFRAEYNSDSASDCGGVLTGSSGRISAHGFRNQECVWNIQSANENVSVLIWFQTRFLYDGSCERDVVEILQGPDLSTAARFCDLDNSEHQTVVPFSNVLIRFISASYYWRLNIRYEIGYCGGIVRDPEGVISLSTNQTTSQNCAWLIIAPDDNKINVHFANVSLHSNCRKQSLKILNGGRYDSPSIGEFCGSSLPADMVSQSNQLFIVLETELDMNIQNAELQIEYFSVERGCGGVYHRNQGHLHSPNFPHSYPNNAQCEWIINVEQGYFVRLTFDPHFDLEAENGCQNDFVKVYDTNSSGQRILLGTWCRNRKPPDLRSSSTQMVIVFQSNADINGNGFSANWYTDCGGTFTADVARIISPGFPQYANNLRCNYSFIPSGNKFISISFSQINIQGGGFGCPDDWLAAYKGNSSDGPLLYKVCSAGFTMQNRGQMYLEFRTDGADTSTGFIGNFRAFHCGGQYNDSWGWIESPLYGYYGSRYLDNINCTWTIIAPQDKVIVLRFITFRIFETPHCSGDYLDVYDGGNSSSALLYHMCGSRYDKKVLTSSTNKLSLTFVTDSSIAARGFSAEYFIIDVCGGVFSQPNGNLTIPTRSRFLHCEWTIHADPGKIISFTITEYHYQLHRVFFSWFGGYFGYGYYENKDLSLQIYDGQRKDKHLLVNVHDASAISSVKSSSNTMVVVLSCKMAYGTVFKFKAYFEQEDAVCSQAEHTASRATQTLLFPSSTNHDLTNLPLRCRWTFDSGSDSLQVTINVSQIWLDPICNNNFLELHDSIADFHGQTVKICNSSIPEIFYSRGRKMSVVYHQNVASNSTGFSLSYQITDCNRTYTGFAGHITSPGYPAEFPANTVCTMTITAPEGTSLAFYFTHFALQPSGQCETNYLEVYNSSTNFMARKCGEAVPPPIFLSSNTAILTLQTSGNATGKLEFIYVASESVSGCGGNLTDIDHGFLTNPGYPDTPQGSQDCTWRLTTSYGRLRVHFESVLMPEKELNDCSASYVQINGQKFCTTYNVNYYHDSSAITICYVSTAGSPATVFKLKFYQID